jgi:hypothetical protein
MGKLPTDQIEVKFAKLFIAKYTVVFSRQVGGPNQGLLLEGEDTDTL